MRSVFYTASGAVFLLLSASLAACAKTAPPEAQAPPERTAAADHEATVTDQAFAQAAQETEERAPSVFDEKPPVGTRAYCLVMETNFTVSAGTPHSEYKDKHYVFCCPPCKTKFDADPEKYIQEI